MQNLPSLPSSAAIKVAAALGQIRHANPTSFYSVSDALEALSWGDSSLALSVFCQASLGLKDGPLREAILDAFDALPDLDAEFDAVHAAQKIDAEGAL